MKSQRVFQIAAVLFVATVVPFALATPPDDNATCSITCTVAEIMEWEGNFPPIDLGTISSQGDSKTGSASAVLYTNGDVTITADNSSAAELSAAGGDTLHTEYKLSYDGDGVTATGGSTVDWTTYNTFLQSGSSVTHVAGDGAVQVTLEVRASNASGTLADSGNYSATQTLTAAWAS